MTKITEALESFSSLFLLVGMTAAAFGLALTA